MYFILLAFGLSYLIGAINPAYIIGRMKGIDIRTVGDKNPGTRNVKKVLGIKYSIPTAIYDVFKGIISMAIAQLLPIEFIYVQLCGLWAIIGHNFPFYIGFRGGQGSATFTGIVLMYTLFYLLESVQIIFILLALAPLWFIFHYVTKRAEMVGLVLMPIYAFALSVNYPENPYTIPLAILFIYMAVIYITFLVKNRVFITQLITNVHFQNHHWRVLARPFAILYGFLYMFYPQFVILLLAGIPAGVFMALDITRLMHEKTNELFTMKIKFLFRSGEQNKISSITNFLCGIFLSILLFKKDIAIVTIVFLIFGDLYGKVFGMAYGRHIIYEKKTLEGSLAYFGCIAICSYFLTNILGISFWILMVSSFIATYIEALPLSLDDNLTVPIITGSAITLMNLLPFV